MAHTFTGRQDKIRNSDVQAEYTEFQSLEFSGPVLDGFRRSVLAYKPTFRTGFLGLGGQIVGETTRLEYTAKQILFTDASGQGSVTLPSISFYGYTESQQVLIDQFYAALSDELVINEGLRNSRAIDSLRLTNSEELVSLSGTKVPDGYGGIAIPDGAFGIPPDGKVETIVSTRGINLNTSEGKAEFLLRVVHEFLHESGRHGDGISYDKTASFRENLKEFTVEDVRRRDLAYGGAEQVVRAVADKLGISEADVERITTERITDPRNGQLLKDNEKRYRLVREAALVKFQDPDAVLSQDDLQALAEAGILKLVNKDRPDAKSSYEETRRTRREVTRADRDRIGVLDHGPNGDVFDTLGEAVDAAIEFAKDVLAENASEIGQIFGSTLGRQLFRNASPNVQFAASTTLGVVGQNLGEIIENNLRSPLDPRPLNSGFKDIADDFKAAGVGALSSYLTAELFDSLNLEGTLGEIGQSVFSSALGSVISNISVIAANPSELLNVLQGVNVGNIVGGYLGTKLAASLVSFDTVEGQIGASVGTAVGTVVGTSLALKTAFSGTKIGGVIAGPIGALVGAAVGYIVGGLIGSLFSGGTPKSSAQLVWDEKTRRFDIGAVTSENKGSKETARNLANGAANALNSVIEISGATLLDPMGVRPGSYGTRDKNLAYRASDGKGGTVIAARSRNPDVVIKYGVLVALSDMLPRLAGGDLLVKRAVASTLTLSGIDPDSAVLRQPSGKTIPEAVALAKKFDFNVLLGNISTARDYASYLENSQQINALIAAEPTSAFAAGWAITFARAMELGLNKRGSTDWVGGWNVYLDEVADGGINGIAFNPSRVGFTIDVERNERLFVFAGPEGELLDVQGDTIDSAAKDRILGSSGDDTIVVSGDRIANTAGLTINRAAASGAEHTIEVAARIDGGTGNDTIISGDLGNDVIGGDGNDTLVGGKLDDWLFGEAGNDRLFAGSANYQFSDSNAAGRAAALNTVSNGDMLDGGDGDDVLYGSKGSDWLIGGAGVDTLYGGAGGDILDGRDGDDRGPNGEARLLGGAGTDQYIFGYGYGKDVILDEADNGNVARATGDSYYNRLQQLNAGALQRNWAGEGDYEVDGSVKGGEDGIAFGPGIGFQDLILQRSGTAGAPGMDLLIQLTYIDPETGARLLSGDELVIQDWFESTRKVEWLRFADGEEIRIGDITSFIVGTSESDVIVGTDGADFLYGGEGNDNLFGLSGDDFGFGGSGNDVVAGDGSNDFVAGGSGDDKVIGGTGNDTVFGDAGTDSVYGGAGSDIVVGGLGDDRVIGGAGDDIFRYQRGDGRDVFLDDLVDNWELVWDGQYTNGYVLDQAFGKVMKNGQEYFDGDRWIGEYDYTDDTKTFRRHLGAVNGALGMNSGIDYLEFGAGIDIQDLMLRRNGNNLEIAITMGDGDARSFDAVADRITIMDWYLTGNSIENFVFLSTGRHDLRSWTLAGGGTEGADTLVGTAGVDWITGNGGDDVISGAAGDDILSGNGGDDSLHGGIGSDVLFGGEGDDVLEGGVGADQLLGGSGVDIASYATSAIAVRATLSAPSTNSGDAAGDVYIGIEGLEGSAGADILSGDGGENVLRGLGGNDTLNGGAGDDIYEYNGLEGQDSIYDGSLSIVNGQQSLDTSQDGGIDTLSMGANVSLSDLTFERFAEGATLRVGVDANHFVNIYGQNNPNTAIELLQLRDGLVADLTRLRLPGQEANEESELLVSDQFAHYLEGRGGDDIISGGGGNDALFGGEGDDILEGGTGGDYLDGGNDSVTAGVVPSTTDQIGTYGDTIRYVGSNAGVSIDLAAGSASGGHADGDAIVNVENVVGSEGYGDLLRGDGRANRLVGLGGHDTLEGQAGDDVLVGGVGNDVLRGGDGADNLAGDDGDDTLEGGNGNDLLAGGAGNDTLRGDAGEDLLVGGEGNDALFGGADDDRLGGDVGDDQLYGEAGNDQLAGGEGNDALFGGDGDDVLAGEAGSDQLRGEAGNDTYVFDLASGSDVIVDTEGANRIALIDATREQVWITRSGDDLRVGVIGGASTITVQGYYAASNPSRMREILLGSHSLFLGFAQPLIDAMTAASVTTPAQMPAQVSPLLDTYWHVGNKAAPDVVDQEVLTNEDTPTSGNVGAIDHDENITSYAIEIEPNRGAVSLDAATGTWTYTPSPNLYGRDGFSIVVTDADNNRSVQRVTVNVASVNDAPSDIFLTDAPASIDERDQPPSGTILNPVVLGTLSAEDVDFPDAGDFASHVFSVADERFEIVEGNALRLKANAALDFETSPTVSIDVTVRDRNGAPEGLSFTKTFTFNVADKDDYFYGTAGNDVLTGQAGRNLLFGLGGDDVLTGGLSNDDLDGGDGADHLLGQGGDDLLLGGLGDDVLEGGAGQDTLHGGDGFDTLRGQDGADQLFGEGGNDLLQGDQGDDQLDGGADNDRLEGGDGADYLLGGSGDDVLIGGAGADRFNGGEGVDTVSYETATSGITVDLTTPVGSTGDASGDVFEDTPEIVIGTSHADSITGSAGSDRLDGRDGNDVLIGGDGEDVLLGGDGDDTLDGGAGNDQLWGGAGNDILIGGNDSDTYLIDRNSGADEIRNFDPNGTDIDVVGYMDIEREHLWFARSGNHLVVSVVGSSTQTSIRDWYMMTTENERSNYKIDFFLAGEHVSRTIDAEALVELMASRTDGMPATQAEYDAWLADPEIQRAWSEAWRLNAPPSVPVIDAQTLNEDGTLTLAVQITDDFTPANGVVVTLEAVRVDNHSIEDLSVVQAPTISAPDAEGNRTLTVATKPNASGQVAIKVTAEDAGGLVTERVFVLTVDPVADAPTVTLAQVATPVAPVTKPTIDSGSLGLAVQAALVDQDGSETLEVRIANVPAGLTLSAGTDLGGGVWSLTPAQLSGLQIQGPATWSTDLALSITAISRETSTGHLATSAAIPLSFEINARPTDIYEDRALSFNENTPAGTGLAFFLRNDGDAGDTATYELLNDAGGRFTLRSDGLLSAGSTNLDFEAATGHAITVRVTDSGGLSRTEDFVVNVINVNEAPTHIYADRALAFNENLANGTGLAFFGANDPEGNVASYSLVDSAGGRFQMRSDGLLLTGGTQLNYEAATGHTITVRATDAGGLFRDQSFYVGVNNVAEAPIFTSPTANFTVFEGAGGGPGSYMGTTTGGVVGVPAVDPDGGALTYSLIGGDTNLFSIDSQGLLRRQGVLDYEGQRNYGVTVRATNSSGLYADMGVSIATVNLNEAPVVTSVSQITYSVDGFGLGYAEHFGFNVADPEGQEVTASVLSAVWGNATTSYYVPYYDFNRMGSSNTYAVTLSHMFGVAPFVLTVRLQDSGGANRDYSLSVSPNYPNSTVQLSPVVLDLDGNDITLRSLHESPIMFDVTGDRRVRPMGWIDAGDAFLALDRDRDGAITNGTEISFVQDTLGATTDLEGLVSYDTNGNGSLDEGDARYGEFLVWQDANQDGVSQRDEIKSLADHGIVSISLERTLTGLSMEGATDNVISATSQFVRRDGSTGTVGDVALAYRNGNVSVQLLGDPNSGEDSLPQTAVSAEPDGIVSGDDSDIGQVDRLARGKPAETDTLPADSLVMLDGKACILPADPAADEAPAVAQAEPTASDLPSDLSPFVGKNSDVAPRAAPRGGSEDVEPTAPREESAQKSPSMPKRPWRWSDLQQAPVSEDAEDWSYEGTASRGALHSSLDSVSRRRLQMVEAMASFNGDKGAAFDLMPRRKIDARTHELLTTTAELRKVI